MKKEVRKKKEKKRKQKAEKRMEKRENPGKSSLDDMIAYVDENGNITSTPPDPAKREKIEAEDIEVSVPPTDPSEKANRVRTGTLTSVNASRGFGFIKDSISGDRIFVFLGNADAELREGDRVSFIVARGHKGPEAIEVSKIP